MKQVETDVVVIAAGSAGLAAAVAAAEGGAGVIAFEKASNTGGTGSMGGGPFAVESRLQRLKQISLTREEAFQIFMDYTHWRVDARLVKAYIDKSASAIDWLENMGVEFVEPVAHFPGAHFTWHIVKPGGEGRLQLDVRGLAPLYTGYLSPQALRAAGLLDGPEADLRSAAAAFAGPVPWMREGF